MQDDCKALAHWVSVTIVPTIIPLLPIVEVFDSLPSETRRARLCEAIDCLVALICSDLICRACNGELGDDRNHVCKRCGVRVHSWVKCASAVRVDDVYWCSEQCKTGNIIINWHLYDMVYIYAATLDEQRSETRTGEVDKPLHIVIEDKAEADTQQPPHQKKGVMKEMKNKTGKLFSLFCFEVVGV